MALFGGLLVLSVALTGASAANGPGESRAHGVHHAASQIESRETLLEKAGSVECALVCLAERQGPPRPEGYRGLACHGQIEPGFAPKLMVGQAPMPPWHPPNRV
ncbi:hypothetical protein [Limimaricola sp.]|uniref:hypothetical protein n=1 Tax=Limimaricola sp. TaxID=2211665 RepID=UPI004059C030